MRRINLNNLITRHVWFYFHVFFFITFSCVIHRHAFIFIKLVTVTFSMLSIVSDRVTVSAILYAAVVSLIIGFGCGGGTTPW